MGLAFGYTYVGECGPLVGCAKHHEGEGGVILGLKTAYKTQVGKFKSGAKFKSKFRKIELPPPAGRDHCRIELAFIRP